MHMRPAQWSWRQLGKAARWARAQAANALSWRMSVSQRNDAARGACYNGRAINSCTLIYARSFSYGTCFKSRARRDSNFRRLFIENIHWTRNWCASLIPSLEVSALRGVELCHADGLVAKINKGIIVCRFIPSLFSTKAILCRIH